MQIFLKQDVESSDVKLMTNYIDQMLRNPHLYLELNHQTSEQNQDSHKLKRCHRSKHIWRLNF